MIVAGWADGYRNNTFRTFEALRCPKRLLLGPWSHAVHRQPCPGPNIDLVPEHLRWWDRWLKGTETASTASRRSSLFAQRSTAARARPAQVDGEWRYEPAVAGRAAARRDALRPWPTPGGRRRPHLRCAATPAWRRGSRARAALPWGQPDDQRPDEAFSLVLHLAGRRRATLEILGYPAARCGSRRRAPVAYLSAKLCDVFPDGTLDAGHAAAC